VQPAVLLHFGFFIFRSVRFSQKLRFRFQFRLPKQHS